MTHVEHNSRLNKMVRLRQRCRDIEELLDTLTMDVTSEQADQLEKANELVQWVKADIATGKLKGDDNAGQ
jgi:hypothetical protein